MFSVSIKNENVFLNFLNSGDTDYVDVYLHDTTATLIMNTSDLFSIITMPCTHTPNETSHGFRIARSILKQQKRATAFSVRFTEDSDVKVSFFAGTELLCDATFTYQKVYSTNYQDKLQLLRNEAVPSGVSLDKLAPLIKLSTALGGVINIESGVISVILQSGIRIYEKTKYTGILCMSPKHAQTLRKCDSTIFSIENYIGAFKDDFAVLANKLRVSSNAEFFSLDQARAQYKAKIDFTNLVAYSSSHPMKIANFTIDLDKQQCTFMEDETTFKIPIGITDEVRAQSDKVHELIVPFSLIRTILSGLGSTTVLFEKKQFFHKMTIGNYIILYN